MKLFRIIKKDFDSNFRIFIYKCVVIFILSISIYEYTVGSKLNKIDSILTKIHDLSQINEDNLKRDFFQKLNSRLNQENFINPEYMKILLKSFDKILEEINRENEKIIKESN